MCFKYAKLVTVRILLFAIVLLALMQPMSYASEAELYILSMSARRTSVSFSVLNNGIKDYEIEPFVAAYTEEGQLFNIQKLDKTRIPMGEMISFSTDIPNYVSHNRNYVKLFIWDDKNKPYAKEKKKNLSNAATMGGGSEGIKFEDGENKTASRYAYVLNAVTLLDDWDEENIKIQLLDKSGIVVEEYPYERVEILNYSSDGKINYENLASQLKNRLIKYTMNEFKGITGIYLATTEANTAFANGLPCQDEYSESGNLYDKTTREITLGGLKSYKITDETYVFYIIGKSKTINMGNSFEASKAHSKVLKGAEHIKVVYPNTPVAVYDVDNQGNAGAVVLYNVLPKETIN